MGEYISDIVLKLKPTINDPEGLTIAKALRQLGFEDVVSVRTGKYYEVSMTAEDAAAADEMALGIAQSRPIDTRPIMTVTEMSTKSDPEE